MKKLGTHLLAALAGALFTFFGQTMITPTLAPAPVAKHADSVVVKTFKPDSIINVKKADSTIVKPKH